LSSINKESKRLTLPLALGSESEPFIDGWLMAPFPKLGNGVDDPASLIPMSVLYSNGGKRGIVMAYSFIEN